MVGIEGVEAAIQVSNQGVGERQTEAPAPHGQGGYLDNCNNPKSALSGKKFSLGDNININPYHDRPDLKQVDLFWLETGPKILTEHHTPTYVGRVAPSIPAQFTDIGLPPTWQRVAANIGTDRFLELLGLLWEFAPRDGERQRVDVPSRDTFTKLFRNGVIRQCAAQGLNSNQTVRSLAQQKINVSETTVNRVLKYLPLE